MNFGACVCECTHMLILYAITNTGMHSSMFKILDGRTNGPQAFINTTHYIAEISQTVHTIVKKNINAEVIVSICSFHSHEEL